MESVKAGQGEKMIKIEVRFFTNGLAKGNGRVRAKHAWAQGMVCLASNDSHGIHWNNPVPFHSPLGIGGAIEKVLKKNGIKLHAGHGMRRFWAK